MRAVLDPNVFISGLLSSQGAPARVLQAWRSGQFEVIVSPQLLEELHRALAYPKLRKHIAPAEARAAIRLLSDTATRVEDAEPHPVVRSSDPGDDYLIALAAEHKAALVSGDRHLLGLKGRIPVYSPGDFLELIHAW